MAEGGENWQERAERAESALAQALEERNRLWAELQRRTAKDREAEHWRRRLEGLEDSLSWRITLPLRTAKAASMRVNQLLEKRRARARIPGRHG